MSFLIALGLGIVLTPLARRVGLAAGVVDRPDGRDLKIHTIPVPLLGGAAVTAAVLVAAAVGRDPLPAALVAGVLVGLATGVVDDVHPLPVWPRLLMQLVAGGVVAAAGARLGVAGPAGIAVVVVLCVILTNAVNLIDGQDLLAGIVVAIAALGLGGLAALGHSRSTLAFATAGGVMAFLIWNRPPARIFLGNGGAYALGVLLTASAASAAPLGFRAVLAAAACLAVPGLELSFTAVRRLGSGAPVGTGDRGHSYDELARRIGRARTTAWFAAAEAAAVGSAFAIRVLPAAAGALLLALEATAAGLWAFGVGNRRRDFVGSS